MNRDAEVKRTLENREWFDKLVALSERAAGPADRSIAYPLGTYGIVDAACSIVTATFDWQILNAQNKEVTR